MTIEMTSHRLTFLSRRSVLALMGLSAAAGLMPNPSFAAEAATLAWTPGASTPQIAIALQKSLWKAENLEVQPISFPTGREALEALLGGGANFASLAEFPVATAALRGQKFIVLASLSTFVGNRIIINGASGAKDIPSLAGHKVGVTLGTNMQFLAEKALAGVKVEFVNVAPGDIAPAIARGDIDAGFLFDTFYPQARSVLGKNYIEVMTPEYQGQFLIVANKDFADKNPATVKAFLTGLLKADEMTKDEAAAASAISASTGGTLSVEAISKQWPNYRYEVGINKALLPLLVEEGAWINKTGIIKTPATAELFGSYIAKDYLSSLSAGRVAP